ncbi:LysR family transcriptional regulator [Arthrobacter sp. JZ12]|uniref:LysR family transcriptional regulator n=1 Tax=Arthrobacter sp. JZ12 TaxID=2654190 RepID=UPI002B479DAE|nr:LysR family transcriptional regulator [Arthrobacter sp. JZ12]
MRPKTIQTALSIGALLPGSDRPDLKVEHQALDLPSKEHSFTFVFQRLSVPIRRAVMQALLVLASYLDEYPAPIDYHRRRQLALNRLLPVSTWREIALDQSIRENAPNTARMYLAYRLTGSILEQPEEKGNGYFLIQNFIAATPAHILDRLDDYARAFLRENSITEPLSWEPPLSVLDGISMPTEPVCSIDPQVEDAVGHGLVEPRLIRQLHKGTAKATEVLPSENDSFQALLRQSLDSGDSVKEIASKLNKSERMVRHHLARLSFPTQPPDRIQVSSDELRDMYIDQRLTLQEISDRTGLSWPVVHRLIHRSGAPLRSPGSPTDRKGIDPQTFVELPALLVNALKGHRGKERLQRFAAISSYPSLNSAVRSLGLTQSRLSTQIKALERNVGGPLLTRAGRGQPMHLTPLGSELLEVAREKGILRSESAAADPE